MTDPDLSGLDDPELRGLAADHLSTALDVLDDEDERPRMKVLTARSELDHARTAVERLLARTAEDGDNYRHIPGFRRHDGPTDNLWAFLDGSAIHLEAHDPDRFRFHGGIAVPEVRDGGVAVSLSVDLRGGSHGGEHEIEVGANLPPDIAEDVAYALLEGAAIARTTGGDD